MSPVDKNDTMYIFLVDNKLILTERYRCCRINIDIQILIINIDIQLLSSEIISIILSNNYQYRYSNY
jgi:hypothetical protein